jgi:hypothetical protein
VNAVLLAGCISPARRAISLRNSKRVISQTIQDEEPRVGSSSCLGLYFVLLADVLKIATSFAPKLYLEFTREDLTIAA